MGIKLKIGLHLGFAITRYPEPEEWTSMVKDELGIKEIQFVSDLIQPHFPEEIIKEQVARTKEACKNNGLKINHTFSSPRLNFLGHPDKKIRSYWIDWMKSYIKISADLGAKSAGSLPRIFSVYDHKNRYKEIYKAITKNWEELSIFAEDLGLEFLTIEPMSIPREMAKTLGKAEELLYLLNEKKGGVPIKFCLDVDHGDRTSPDPRDNDPYEWLKKFGAESPVIHLKQKSASVHGHKPFTEENNKEGLIFPEKLKESLEISGSKENTLFLELSFRERLPFDDQVVRDLKASVDYWRPFCDI